MASYAGLDVSDKSTHVCLVDGEGAIAWHGVCATDPEVIAKTLARHAGRIDRLVLETGSLSAFLYHGLAERGVSEVPGTRYQIGRIKPYPPRTRPTATPDAPSARPRY